MIVDRGYNANLQGRRLRKCRIGHDGRRDFWRGHTRQQSSRLDSDRSAIADFETAEGQSAIQGALHKRFAGAKLCEFVRRSLDNLREVSTIVDTKALGDETAFKAWLRGISQKVARPPWRVAHGG